MPDCTCRANARCTNCQTEAERVIENTQKWLKAHRPNPSGGGQEGGR